MKTVLKFCFKGSRNYVQGPDIVAALFKHFSDVTITDIDLKFHGITSTNLDLLESDGTQDEKVSVRLKSNGNAINMHLVENGEAIDCRHEYHEEKIINLCEFNLAEQLAVLKQDTDYSPCENFVAMNKALLQKLYPDERGKWYFTRLEQHRVIEDSELVSIRLIKNFNFRLTKSDIFVGDEKVGSVYFTMVKG